MIATLAIGHFRLAHAQEDVKSVGVIDNRWKIDDVRKAYEEYAQLKQKEYRQKWRKQLVDSTGIAWDLSDAIGMIRGKVDPTTVSEEPECLLDAACDSVDCFRLTVVPVRSDLTDVKVSIGEFRSVNGTSLPIRPLVQTAEDHADGGWNLTTPREGDTIGLKDRREYVVFVNIPKSALSDEYFGNVILNAKEKVGNKPVRLVLPLRLQVRDYSLPSKVAYVDKNRLSRDTLARIEYGKFRQLCTMLADELDSNLPKWAKTEDDKLFVRQCQTLLKDCRSVESGDVEKRKDYASLKRELAGKLDRARLVQTCKLHNVTIKSSDNVSGRSILSPKLYIPAPGEIVVSCSDLIYKSDAVCKDVKTVYAVSHDNGLTWEPYKGNVADLDRLQAAVLPPDGKTRILTFSYGWENHPESDRDQLEAKGLYIFDAREGNIPGVLSICYRVGMKRSRDGGATWETGEIKLPRFMPDLRQHMMGIALHDGTYLYPTYGRYDMKKEEVCFISRPAHDRRRRHLGNSHNRRWR